MFDVFDVLFSSLAWLLDFFYRLQPSYGMAIILLTIVVYAVAFPLNAKSTRSMAAMSKLQPELQKIRQRYPDDRQKQSEETFALMREHGASPFGGCLPVLVQMPVFIIMYQVILGLTRRAKGGGFNPKYLADDSVLRDALEGAGGKMTSFGLDLAKTASDAVTESLLGSVPFLLMIMAIVGTGYFQQYQISRRNAGQPQAMADNPYAQQMQRMTKIMPLMYLFFGFTVPAGVVLYLLVSNIFRIIQQTLIYRFDPTLRMPAGSRLHEAKEANAEESKPEKDGKERAKPKDSGPKDTKPKSASKPSKDSTNGKPSPNGRPRTSGRATPKKKKGR